MSSAERVSRTSVVALDDALARSALGVERSASEPVLVAVDGGRASLGALAIASALAQRDHCVVDALYVDTPFPSQVRGLTFDADAMHDALFREGSSLWRVRRQLRERLRGVPWQLHVEFGAPATTITDAAASNHAQLILVGLSRHHPLRRAFGAGTPREVVIRTSVPVLAVAATARGLPRNAIALIDFSPSSVHAAREAVKLLAPPATLHLRHVRPQSSTPTGNVEGWSRVYATGASVVLASLARDLEQRDITVKTRTERGDVVPTVLRAARILNADLIACGTSAKGFVDELVTGNLATELLRQADTSVLVVPIHATQQRRVPR